MRYRGFWLGAGWVQVVVVIVLGLIPGPTGLPTGFAWAAHILQFVVLMIWFGGIFAPSRHWQLAAALVGLGIAIEIMQAANIFRTFDLKDIVANTAGVVIGVVMVRTVLRNWCQRAETLLLRLIPH